MLNNEINSLHKNKVFSDVRWSMAHSRP